MKLNSWSDQIALEWLLEENSPGVRYVAMRDLLKLPQDDPTLAAARKEAHLHGEIAHVLASMNPDGFWVRPGAGYNPKYRSAVWSLTMLAQMGASIEEDARINTACNYMLDHGLCTNGQFTSTGAPSGTIDCLQGNMCRALVELGCNDERLVKAFDWMARSVTGEGVADTSDRSSPLRYYAYKCAPDFACGITLGSPCAWGAVKVMMAFGSWPAECRTRLIEEAIQRGVDLLFSSDPAKAIYPDGKGGKPSRNWWKFGFPVFYITDLLQIVEALAGLGYTNDPRLDNAYAFIRSKQDPNGRWPLDYHYSGKTWVEFGAYKAPSKWVTLRALRALNRRG